MVANGRLVVAGGRWWSLLVVAGGRVVVAGGRWWSPGVFLVSGARFTPS
jgi:hypothetical protein